MTRFIFKNIQLATRSVALVLATCFLVAGTLAFAAQEKFDYDPLGRLVRVVDEQGRVTNYIYDLSGNLLQVITNGTLTPPSISSITPNALRRGEIRSFTINGAELNSVRLTASDPDLALTKLVTTNGQITFDLSATTGAVLGPHAFAFENSAGSASAIVSVNPLLPSVLVSPAPLAIPPDGRSRQFIVRLTNSDSLPHTINLSTGDATIATVAPASVTIAAGTTEIFASITGVRGGTTSIILNSATLNATTAPVFITADFVGISTSFANLLGVVVEQAPVAPVNATITPIVSPLLGVLFGSSFIDAMSPRAISIGSNAVPLTLSGNELQDAASIAVVPATGVTLGALTVAADGRSVTVPVTVASNAPTTPRRLVLRNALGLAYTVVRNADILEIVEPGPEIDSIDPIFARPGATAIPFLVRGRNFQDFFDLRINPASGISIGSFPIINPEGTRLSATISISANATPGPRTVVLETLGGVSSAVPVPANTFSVVTDVQPIVTPIASALLGVTLEEVAAPISTGFALAAPNLGLAIGPIVTGINPPDGEIGTSLSLSIQGNELSAATVVSFTPATGLTASALSVAADGKSLTVNLAIDPAAPRTVRRVDVLAGATAIPFTNSTAGQFLVTSPQPEIDSITPLFLQVGAAPSQLTVRGKNFDLAQAVRIVPPDGVIVSASPVVSADNRSLTVNISAAAGAVLGARSVVVVTPAGETSSAQTAANTITVSNSLGSTFTPIISALLGVVIEEVAAPISTTFSPIISPSLGVSLEIITPPPSTTFLQPAPNVGVALGPIATNMQPRSALPGATTTLTITGFGLDSVTGVTVVPADGISVGVITTQPDGSQLSVPITLAANAAATLREIRLIQGAGRVEFSDPATNRLRVAVGVPNIISITPILASQGTTFSLTIRGANLQGTSAVQATPDLGLIFGSDPVVNAAGTEVTVGVAITGSADLGPRVIQVVTPGGASSSVAAPANTFTVFPP